MKLVGSRFRDDVDGTAARCSRRQAEVRNSDLEFLNDLLRKILNGRTYDVVDNGTAINSDLR